MKCLYETSWAQSLTRRGLNEIAVVTLEALGPLVVLLAQIVYIGQPFFRGLLPEQQWPSLIAMLEDQQQRNDFIALLEDRSN
jgi:hypothetical protein